MSMNAQAAGKRAGWGWWAWILRGKSVFHLASSRVYLLSTGSQINFISLFQVTFVLLLPGLNQHGIILKYIGMAKREINKLLKQKEKKNE